MRTAEYILVAIIACSLAACVAYGANAVVHAGFAKATAAFNVADRQQGG